jgi:anaerobic glycerol-3-phosphate dehydrogenase
MTEEDRVLGEQIKATIIAIYEYWVAHPYVGADVDQFRKLAVSFRQYQILSKRNITAARSQLNSTLRGLKEVVRDGYWPKRELDALKASLRRASLIDIETFVDTDAKRVNQVLERGEIKTTAEYRLILDKCDEVNDARSLKQLGSLISAYEKRRKARKKERPPRSH